MIAAGTYRLLAARRDREHVRVRLIDQSDESTLAAALNGNPSLVPIETPSHPLMRIVDIRAIATRASAAGAKVAVDNTFLSPALQQPIPLGADDVIHSTTKYLNGHSDVVGGAVVATSQGDAEALATWAKIIGVTGAPFDAYPTLRGRPQLACADRPPATIRHRGCGLPAAASACPRGSHPGLPSDPAHAIATVQQSGFGAVLSFELRGGCEHVRHFVEPLEVFTLAESLGGVESLISHPVTMTHAGMSEEARRTAGIGEGLLRLSIGLEAETDLVGDLERGFSALATRKQSMKA